MSQKNLYFIFVVLLMTIGLAAISYPLNSTSKNEEREKGLTDVQEQLISEGWYLPITHYSGELPDKLGMKSRYGQQDNYFDIEMGPGCDVALKIINKTTNECIRYAYVLENSTSRRIPKESIILRWHMGRIGWNLKTETEQ